MRSGAGYRLVKLGESRQAVAWLCGLGHREAVALAALLREAERRAERRKIPRTAFPFYPPAWPGSGELLAEALAGTGRVKV